MRRPVAEKEPSEFIIESLPPRAIVTVDDSNEEEITARYSFSPEAASGVRRRHDCNAVTLASFSYTHRAWPAWGSAVVAMVVLVALTFDASALGVAGLAFAAVGAIGVWTMVRK